MNILQQDATAQLAALTRKEISARELLTLSLAQTDRLNRTINAVVSRDLAQAHAAAEAFDTRRARGESIGVLGGLPMTVKDTLDVEGLPASAGMKALLNRTARDAEVVRRAKDAGAIVWGKTNTPVKAADWQSFNSVYGTTNNPWDISLTPGGSSGGSAAALASGMTALEIGADIGGSLRIPAAFCGVFAHKPTYGLVSQRGLVPPPDSTVDIDLAVVGPMARSARDLRLLLSTIADMPDAPPRKSLKDLRIALWQDEPSFALDPDSRSVLLRAAENLESAGVAIDDVSGFIQARDMMRAYTTLLFSIVGSDANLLEWALYRVARLPAKAEAQKPDPAYWAQIIMGFTATPDELLRASAVRAQLESTMADFFSRYDAVIAPVTPTAAFVHDRRPMLRRELALANGQTFPYLKMYDWIALATLCGLPATSMPAGLNGAGLPVGLQIMGPRGGDALTLGIAETIEGVLGGFRAPPL